MRRGGAIPGTGYESARSGSTSALAHGACMLLYLDLALDRFMLELPIELIGSLAGLKLPP